MKIYEVVRKYFKTVDMWTSNSFLLDLPECPESKFESTKDCDTYRDYFTDPVKAEEFRQQRKNYW